MKKASNLQIPSGHKAACLFAISLSLGFGIATKSTAQSSDYYGKVPVPVDDKTKSPATEAPDPFGSPLFIDGRTDVAIDSRSLAAQEIENREKVKQMREQIDRSIRSDISTGQPVTVLIAPEHFTQLTFMRSGEIVYPRRAFTGQPALLIIDKKETSPYVYISASAMVEGQTTNLFVETEEDGKIQTYVVKLMVTEPKNIREQVSVNLVEDHTPPIRGTVTEDSGVGQVGQVATNGPTGAGASSGPGGTGAIGGTVGGKFTADEVKQYLNTMIEMADHYQEAKMIEKNSGRVIYRDTDIKGYPSGQFNYMDPVEGTSWIVHQVWFFPKYDAILLDTRCENPNNKVSMWDFSQMKWQANNSPVQFATTAAAPISMQTLPKRTNQIWYLVQGNRLDPHAEFSPVFPRADRRGQNATNGTSQRSSTTEK